MKNPERIIKESEEKDQLITRGCISCQLGSRYGFVTASLTMLISHFSCYSPRNSFMDDSIRIGRLKLWSEKRNKPDRSGPEGQHRRHHQRFERLIITGGDRSVLLHSFSFTVAAIRSIVARPANSPTDFHPPGNECRRERRCHLHRSCLPRGNLPS